jgi:5-methylcytosine-specific restriction protein B
MAEAFLALSRRARGLELQPLDAPAGNPLDECQKTLKEVFTLLHQMRLEFAFRTIAEVIRYLHVDFALAPDKTRWHWEYTLDAQLLQKILPKLHGSRRRLEAVLVSLAAYCEKRDLAAAQEPMKKDADLSMYPLPTSPASVTFPLSRTKLLEMLDAVRRDQFVSFIQ